MDLNELKSNYALSDDEFQEIQNEIIAIYTEGVTPSPSPAVIILGGQPGAGKSELITAALRLALLNNEQIVTCNADEYRDYHPQSDEIKKNHERYYPEITVTYSQPWNNGLRTYCEENRLNYILETTFSSGKVMNDTIRDIKQKGYQVILMVLAVHKKWSLLGTYIRYEDMKRHSGTGRQVSQKIHDEKYQAIPETLKAVHEGKLYDHLLIYGRNFNRDPTRSTGIKLIANNPSDPLAVYIKERDRPWSISMTQQFADACAQIISLMEKRAGFKAITRFKENLNL
jgi:predicted ABC-type ATPase